MKVMKGGPLMRHSRLRAAGVVVLAASLVPSGHAAPAPLPSDDAAIVHVLNRLAYGPRPGDVDTVRTTGLSRWIEQQLEPSRIDDPVVAAKLAGLKTASLSARELLAGYELPREARREIQQKRAELDDASEEDMRRARRELIEKYGSQMEGAPRQVTAELQEAKVLRAVYSERQLDEVLVDFWLNHFNVYAQKGPLKFLIGEYEHDVIRPHAWGRFEDLLLATAESPAMLFYLDNWMSSDPDAKPFEPRRGGFGRRFPMWPAGDDTMRLRPAGEQNPSRRRGLNENYAREIMELHTLGVDGGYTQKDVTEVARCFTGWTIEGLRQQDPRFRFEPRFHDNGTKIVLGQTIKGSGQDEGRKVVHMLATHPATARFVSTKLARRFVSDDPPAALVARAAETFRKTDGNIREVVRTIVTSPEFLAPQARTAKVKTPLEFVVSAVRASGATVVDATALARRIGEMGMPLYMQQPPTGYKDTADAWVSTSGLLARLNFALDLAENRVSGVLVNPATLVPTAGPADALSASLAARFVPQGLSDQTRKTLAAEAELTPSRVAGLVLGSPEFQRR
jgi:uncharacterized protein (DUF1800 family)